MAFGAQNINPIDLNPNIGVGVNLPFNGPSVFNSNYYTQQAVKNNLINFFLTNPGEIPLNPNFGGGLRNFIFEQISSNNLTFLKNSINDKLALYFSFLDITNLEVFDMPSTNTITIKFSYQIKNTNIDDNLTLSFTNP